MENSEPIALFKEWMEDARKAGVIDPTAMSLATVDAQNHPEVRMVLLKGVDERGFVFYTNLDSPKAAALKAHPYAALCFHWAQSERQVRISGPIEPVSDTEADAYFASRPRLSQIGAWASKQSQPMEGYWELEKAVAATTLRYPFGSIPRPPNWSGYRVKPEKIEFWHQHPFRHHKRFVYVRDGAAWKQQWLFP
jgi:pyridoxamine 5'-phosphate oxidase